METRGLVTAGEPVPIQVKGLFLKTTIVPHIKLPHVLWPDYSLPTLLTLHNASSSDLQGGQVHPMANPRWT